MNKIRNCEIAGHGTYLPERTVTFGDQTRYRIEDDMSQIDMLSAASLRALENAELEPNQLDCIIGASAAGVQPLPSTAALLQERIAPDAQAAALDINSSCTSFITAFDLASRYIQDGQYERVLIASGDVGSRFLNPNQKESYELFSDAGVAMIVTKTDDETKGVIASAQQTWPKHAHDTEIRGGISAQPSTEFASSNPEDYMFDMNGRAALMGMLRVLPPFFERFYEKSDLSVEDFEWVIPHQASRALALAMKKLDIPEGKYADYVQDYGNMVSASVPFAFAKKLGEGALKAGDMTLLCGTAAGLTANALAIRL
jgi:3-oxoacyl-[acyl-carrier-protein] synthase-3